MLSLQSTIGQSQGILLSGQSVHGIEGVGDGFDELVLLLDHQTLRDVSHFDASLQSRYFCLHILYLRLQSLVFLEHVTQRLGQAQVALFAS